MWQPTFIVFLTGLLVLILFDLDSHERYVNYPSTLDIETMDEKTINREYEKARKGYANCPDRQRPLCSRDPEPKPEPKGSCHASQPKPKIASCDKPQTQTSCETATALAKVKCHPVKIEREQKCEKPKPKPATPSCPCPSQQDSCPDEQILDRIEKHLRYKSLVGRILNKK